MSNTHLTQCPHCQATFKVQDQHLNAAGGKVRCGSCLEVFNALDNLIDSSAKASAPAQPTKQRNQAASAPSPVTSQAAPQTPEPTPPSEPEEDESELVFEDNPDEDSQDDSYTGEGAFSSELSDSFLELDGGDSGHFSESELIDDINDDVIGNKTNSDESWAESMLEDDSSELKTQENKEPEDSFQLSNEFIELDKEPSVSSTTNEQEDSLNAESLDSDTISDDQLSKTQTQQSINADSSQQYKHLQAAPLDLPNRSNRSFIGSLIWTILNVSLLIILCAQFAWYNYGKLAQYEELRPVYETACQLLKCKLPDLVDTTQIRSQNLIVRSHPTAKKALIIDAVIVNQAPYAQPFPNLALYFSDLNNKIVAQRLFEPSEYLAGDVKDWTGMPKGTPIHISLEILDPGNDAVNYTVGFYKHTPQKTQK